MRKLLLALLILGCGDFAGAQSINLLNLTNLTILNSQQAAGDFAARKIFKPVTSEEIDGFLVETYQTAVFGSKLEMITVGKGYKLAKGGVLHTVSYFSADPKNVIALIKQSKSIGVKQTFHGADQYDNIYIFDSYLYRMTARISFDGTRSTLDISQKQVFVEED